MTLDFSRIFVEYADYWKQSFVTNIPDRLRCILCKYVIRNARQTICGCKTCDSCIRSYLGDEEKPCPSKESDCKGKKLLLNRDIFNDNATNKEVGNLQIKCRFEGCLEINTLKNMITHIATCDYRTVQCLLCKNIYAFKQETNHIEEQCEMRMVPCPHCLKKVTFKDLEDIHLHYDSEFLCDLYKGDCPNKCGATKALLKVHLRDCPNKKIMCPFYGSNCKSVKMSKGDLTNHLTTDIISHVQFLVDELEHLRIENLTLSKGLARLEKLTRENMNVITKITEINLKHSKEIEKLNTQRKDLKYKDVFRNGVFIWKVKYFDILKRDAENGTNISVLSEPFYTSDFGYKLCLKIYPAGDGIGRGRYMSLFFVIMKGENDEILQWPFKHKITLSILSQGNIMKTHSETFRPDPMSVCYKQPTTEYNVASGSPKFIEYTTLTSDSGYCRDNTIFIKAIVDSLALEKT